MNRSLSRRFLVGKAVLAILVGILAMPAIARGEDSKELTVRILVKSSPTAVYALHEKWSDSQLAKTLETAVPRTSEEAPELGDLYVETTKNGRASLYRMDVSGNLWSEDNGGAVKLPRESALLLRKEAERLSRAHFGELVDWNEASRIVPRLKVFTVVDLETGLSFRVQRRAGRDHADVQPVSREDSAIMKQIYEGRWSWRRKAILVRADGRQLAASMNGMPHGGDGIPGNDFKGHFCIHFLDSSTHKSEVPDLAHQLMVFKAAGQPRALLQRLTPLTQAESLSEAMNQQDREWVRLFLERAGKAQTDRLLGITDTILAIRPASPERMHFEEDLLTAEGELTVAYERSGKGKKSKPLRFEFVRLSPAAPWRIHRMTEEL
ncbi:hypothetical protein [Cohnella sp. AR92]|uniref:hypothetical protein n=1 Tax=Cohnella sp. AR92 TaxID=648716 RepID=UPI000F8EF209|nr:hypothetical protein [Cohnella sp. AR92]RUS47950.1 hypothetical protein ELR57_05285 [Cohnella sp. AR92]